MRLLSVIVTFICSTVCLFLLMTCTPGLNDPVYEEQLVVNAYLLVGHGIDSVYVSRTLPIQQAYSYEAAAVAVDSIFLSVDGKTYSLMEYVDKSGAYYLPSDSLIVTPGKTYHLCLHVENRTVRASTTAPGQIQIRSVNPDTSYYPYPDPELSNRFQLTWDPTDFTAAYEISVIAHPPYDLVNFGIEQIVEQHLKAVDYDTLRAFPPVQDFPVSKNETSMEIPWFTFFYYGNYTLKLYAIDDNLWDLVRSQVLYIPQSSEFEHPMYHIDGGLGIFAAVSVDSVHVVVKKQE